MTCDQYQDLLELYALGVLENPESAALAEHLETGCHSCHQALRLALNLNTLVARAAPLADPPSSLRRRIANSVAAGTEPRRNWLPWALATAALLALAIGLAFQFRQRSNPTETETAQTRSVGQQSLSSALQILGAPGTKAVPFTDSRHPELHGAVYVHRKLGLALVIDRLPAAPAGWKYESWVVPKTGAPQPVEPFHPDNGGRAVSVVPGPVEVAQLNGLAVSMEPLDSRPTKPTTLVFEAPL